jgi:retinol dehydrogenase-14
MVGAARREEIREALLAWFRENARDLPWRHTRDPWRVLVSEVMLQQIQVKRAVPFYKRFLERFPTVEVLAGEVLSAYPRLDVLLNNVGGFWAHRHVTSDGLERTYALNHLAPFLLTSLLLERLVASAPARVVTVSSGAQAQGKIDFDDPMGGRKYSGQRAYSQSKLANVMFTYELARRLEGTGVTATALHPGVTRTAFGAEDSARAMAPIIAVLRPFMRSPERGADTAVYLASSPEVEGVTGRYFANRKAKKSHKSSYDTATTARLWQVSADLVGLPVDARH